MAQLTVNGYVIKNQNGWFADEEALYRAIDPNWNLDPSAPDGLKLASDAEIFANLDEIGQRAYNSKDPNKAKGVDLNSISFITGTIRKQGTFSTVILTLSGVVGTVIVAGKLVESTVDGSRWRTNSTVTISSDGTVTVGATAVSVGATQAATGTITRIASTVGGWQGATNLEVATSGTNVETDAQLRRRRTLEVGQPGNNQVDSMLAEIFPVEGVRRAIVLENDADTTDANGLPRKSIAPIVDGGSDSDVALAIFRTKNPGVLLHAAGTSVTVPDVFDRYPSNTKDITFSRPVYVDVIVTVTVQRVGNLPNDTDDLIKQAIIDYSLGTLTEPECGFNTLGFDIGEDVPINSIHTPVNNVIGRYGHSYVTGITLQGSTTNITIAFNELSRWALSNITVTINT